MWSRRTRGMYPRLYRSLYRIRRVEEEVARVYPSDCIKSPVHLSIGQEAVSVGVCEALRPDDVVFGTYRGHALGSEVARVYPSDCIKSPVHLSIGQEAVSVGVCEALRPDDVVFGTYRGHAL